jgi:hypothetical protein
MNHISSEIYRIKSITLHEVIGICTRDMIADAKLNVPLLYIYDAVTLIMRNLKDE